MSANTNKAILTRFWQELFNDGNTDAVDDLVVQDYLNHELSPGEEPGSEGLKQFILFLRSAFPDMFFTVQEMVAEDDKVVTRWISEGSHRGEFMGVPPTGIKITTNGMAMHRISDGKIVEAWNNWDALGLLTQLGVAPQSGGDG